MKVLNYIQNTCVFFPLSLLQCIAFTAIPDKCNAPLQFAQDIFEYSLYKASSLGLGTEPLSEQPQA